MKNQIDARIVGISGVLVGILLALVLVPWLFSTNISMPGWGGMYNRGAMMDRHFIEEMIPHHQGAIDMAKLALEKSKNPALLTLAGDIISAQTKEIEQMRLWYSEWFGTEVPVATTGSMMGMGHGGMQQMASMQGDLDSLKNATNFEAEFVSQMIPHHEMAVMMARMLLSATSRPELKTFAQDIIKLQTAEIELMKSIK